MVGSYSSERGLRCLVGLPPGVDLLVAQPIIIEQQNALLERPQDPLFGFHVKLSGSTFTLAPTVAQVERSAPVPARARHPCQARVPMALCNRNRSATPAGFKPMPLTDWTCMLNKRASCMSHLNIPFQKEGSTTDAAKRLVSPQNTEKKAPEQRLATIGKHKTAIQWAFWLLTGLVNL